VLQSTIIIVIIIIIISLLSKRNWMRLIRSLSCLSACLSVYKNHLAVYVSVYPPLNFWIHEPIFMKLGMCITASESNLTAYVINSCHQSVCLYLYPPVVARYPLCKHVPASTNTRNSKRIAGLVVFCAVRVISKRVWVWNASRAATRFRPVPHFV
jgi:hypothetical protein